MRDGAAVGHNSGPSPLTQPSPEGRGLQENGNALFAVFGAVVLVGILAASVNTFVRGPLTGAIKQTRMNAAKAQMQIAGQSAVMSAVANVPTPFARVFVTTGAHNGNFGGLTGADAYCQSKATSVSLPGTYKAWLSTPSDSPSTRFNKLNAPYKLVDGTLLANNWADFIDGNLAANPDKYENGTTVVHNPWSWTEPDGTPFPHNNNHCNNWTDGTNSYNGHVGRSDIANSGWSDWGGTTPCNLGLAIYCVQQEASGNVSAGGDCDSDGVVEPLEMRPAGALPAPTGGGLVPAKIGITKKDPWGTEYGYCSWDYGSVSLNASCQQETPGTNARLAGHATNRAAPVVALISAGPDRKFTTTCRTFAAADVNSNGVLTDSGDLPLIDKVATTDDDVIFTYTYDEAMNASGGLWKLKSGAPNVATIAKSVEAQEARFTGAGLFAKLSGAVGGFLDVVSGIRLGSPAMVSTCDAANTNALRRNASSNGIEICNGTGWATAVAFGTGSGGDQYADVPPVTENKVFVTSAAYTGNLGGISGADAICQRHANAANLPGKYMAWLADITGSPATRFYQSTVPYKLVDGTIIANNWADLTDGTIAAGITKSENNATVTGAVFSNAFSNGNNRLVADCKLWTDATSAENGATGQNTTTTTWSHNGANACNTARLLYCFQQTEAVAWVSGGSTAGDFDTLSDAMADYANAKMSAGPGSGAAGTDTLISWGSQNFTNSASAKESVAMGAEAAKVLNTNSTVAMGYRALMNTTTGSGNIAIGSLAGAGMAANDYDSILLGYNTSRGSGSGNIYVGADSGKGGVENLTLGAETLSANTANSNTALGYRAMTENVTGEGNAAIGAEALRYNVSGHRNVAIGYQTMRQNRADENVGVGQRALSENTVGARLVAIGSEASRYQTGNDNTAIGTSAMKGVNLASTGTGNTALGTAALTVNTSGIDNTAVGYQALSANSTGFYNTALGYGVLKSLSSGNDNTAIGTQTFRDLSTGFDNTGIGPNAFLLMTSGNGNTGIGYTAGTNILTGSGHTLIGALAQGNGNPSGPTTAIGHYSLYDNTGSGNTGVGSYSLQKLNSGANNTAIGYSAGVATGSVRPVNNLTAIGSGAAAAAAGDNVTAIGYQALALSTGANNTGMGYRVMANLTTGINNTAVGHEAGLNMTTASNNTLAGYQSGYSNVTGDFVTAAGYQSLYSNLAPANTALGYQALYANTNGLYNTAIGYGALQANTVGNFNTAIGVETLKSLNGTYTAADCAGLGSARASDPNTGHCFFRINNPGAATNAANVCTAASPGSYPAVISNAAEHTIANTACGSTCWLGADDSLSSGAFRWKYADLAGIQFWQGNSAGTTVNDLYVKWSSGVQPSSANSCIATASTGFFTLACSTTSILALCEKEPTYAASFNTAVGYTALTNATDGNNNTALGYEALLANTTGSDNTAIGHQALSDNTTGSQNVAVGYKAGPTTNNLSNTIALGNGASVTASNTVRVGDTAITAITGQVAFSAPSDMRLKKDIAPSDLGLDFIMGLKPVSYRLKQGNGRLDYGFLAQDIEASLDGRITNMITRRNDEMRTYQLRASDLIAPLVKALQEQDATIIRLQAKIDSIKSARMAKACTRQNAEGRE